MELHKALKKIIDTEGTEIIKDLRLVNILDDLKAYEDIPASKYILRSIIAEGYSIKLIENGKWDNILTLLANKFAKTTGFIPQNVNLIFQSLAYGLGYLTVIKNDIKKFNYQKTNYNKQDLLKLTRSEQEDLISSLIEIDPVLENNFGIIIIGSVKITNPTLYINIELSGNLSYDNLPIAVALYKKNGALLDIKGVCRLSLVQHSKICRFQVFFDNVLIIKEGSSYSDYKCKDIDISKIIVFTNF